MRFNLRFNAFAAFILLGMATLSGCTTNPATGEQSFTGFMSVEDEQKVGAEEHPKMLKAFGGTYSDAELQAYVQAIGQKLAKQSEIPNQRFQFFVLNDDTVNAFALPGGYVYVSRGLVTLAEDEAEFGATIFKPNGDTNWRDRGQHYRCRARRAERRRQYCILRCAGRPSELFPLTRARSRPPRYPLYKQGRLQHRCPGGFPIV